MLIILYHFLQWSYSSNIRNFLVRYFRENKFLEQEFPFWEDKVSLKMNCFYAIS